MARTSRRGGGSPGRAIMTPMPERSDPPPDAGSDIICDIAAGRLAAEVIFRDDLLIAFLDHRPVFPGHVLVNPVEHVDDLNHLDEALMGPLLALGRRVSLAQQSALAADGSFVAVNNIVSQSVPHVHLHVVPRKRRDGLRGFFWPRRRYAVGEAEQVASMLRAALTG